MATKEVKSVLRVLDLAPNKLARAPADIYREQDNYVQAESLYLQALTIQERHLSPHDPDRARSLLKLAKRYEKREQHEQAESLRQEACSIFEQPLGKEHPETVKARTDSARLLEEK